MISDPTRHYTGPHGALDLVAMRRDLRKVDGMLSVDLRTASDRVIRARVRAACDELDNILRALPASGGLNSGE